MLRSFNYTGRKRIPRSLVSVRMLQVSGKAPAFDISFDLSSMDLPGHAKVYVEAYHRASYMRFPFGYVSDVVIPADRTLTDIEAGGTAQFRLKVIDNTEDHGQVLAEADGLSPLDTPDNSGHRPILPVELCDLGDQIWRVSFESTDGRPVLELNKEIDGIAQLAKTDDGFLSLVHPAVIRLVLARILIGSEAIQDSDGPSDDWRYQWLRFARSFPTILPAPLPDEDGSISENLEERQIDWIDEVVAAFCKHYQILSRFTRTRGQEDC